MTTDVYYTLAEASALLKVHVQTLRRWIRQGRLPARRFGRQYRLRSEDIEALARPAPVNDDEADQQQFDDLSLAALAELWDNEEDAIYDDWKTLYGVEEG